MTAPKTRLGSSRWALGAHGHQQGGSSGTAEPSITIALGAGQGTSLRSIDCQRNKSKSMGKVQ